MFNNPLSLNWRTILIAFVKNSIYFVLLSFSLGYLLPKLTTAGQLQATALLLEHSAPITFNLLGAWSIFFIAGYITIFGTVTTPSRILSWLGLCPAEATFNYGSISTGLVLGLGISGMLFWHEKSATFLLIGSLRMLLLFFVFVFLIKNLCIGISRISQLQHRFFAGIMTLLTPVITFYTYKNIF